MYVKRRHVNYIVLKMDQIYGSQITRGKDLEKTIKKSIKNDP